jgi:hypothetical protein
MIKATAPRARNGLCIPDSIKGEHCPHRGGVSDVKMDDEGSGHVTLLA